MADQKWTGVIGLMSGTSLDGLDICYVEFAFINNTYEFRNLKAKTIAYSETWKHDLKNAFYLSPPDLEIFDSVFGKFLAQNTLDFISENVLQNKVELIASHGHTVFHQPNNKITVQIGSGKELNELTGIKVINDFRIKDVLLGGQGAPLVPVGDLHLFSKYQACLNLGGFSNISFDQNQKRIAFDISPCNLPINQLCKKYFNLEFDRNGDIARSGTLIESLFNELNAIPYYSQSPPKSLGFEWLTEKFMPIVDGYADHKPEALIRTITDHVGFQINEALKNNKIKEVLVTGGGAYNQYLINYLKKGEAQIVIPPAEIVEFKEALIFAFLGYLNLNNSINTLKSVTGASEDSIGGVRHFGHQQ
ncbi:MAG: anhydro-N-acetylmuramic acid kinase [Crocinitomicaceae bacterium]|nr:anhydro-N-acetylmuramic acid kinase [Crocinitomicaceae bacterium]MBK6953387.1 anhydro-N-acetylmuramic acid kinase [Crocinitomicaceae bacterium]MBK9593698.1 anhydro-N-acetylmuramic acid kinase [Crocinitomicaceae bacterium]